MSTRVLDEKELGVLDVSMRNCGLISYIWAIAL